MTDNQLYLAIGLPCFTIIVSLIINLITISGMREDIREIRSDLKSVVASLGVTNVELGRLMDRAK